jgi:hypothetical protein
VAPIEQMPVQATDGAQAEAARQRRRMLLARRNRASMVIGGTNDNRSGGLYIP